MIDGRLKKTSNTLRPWNILSDCFCPANVGNSNAGATDPSSRPEETDTGSGWGSALTNYLAVGTYAYSTANLLTPPVCFIFSLRMAGLAATSLNLRGRSCVVLAADPVSFAF